MQPDSAKYLRDMLDAASAIVGYAKGKTEDEYQQSRTLRDAIQWNFCVIGEALAQLLAKNAEVGEKITDSRKIIGLRNQLIHGYGVIDNQITWSIIQDKLPILIQELEQFLA